MSNTNYYTIAIIEDEKMLLKYMASSLSADHEFRVITAMDGEEGEQLIIKEKPDLVFLDLIMPKKNGFELLEVVKKRADTKNIPIVILSNLGQEKDIKHAKELGARDYLIKVNLEINDLVKIARTYLDKH